MITKHPYEHIVKQRLAEQSIEEWCEEIADKMRSQTLSIGLHFLVPYVLEQAAKTIRELKSK